MRVLVISLSLAMITLQVESIALGQSSGSSSPPAGYNYTYSCSATYQKYKADAGAANQACQQMASSLGDGAPFKDLQTCQKQISCPANVTKGKSSSDSDAFGSSDNDAPDSYGGASTFCLNMSAQTQADFLQSNIGAEKQTMNDDNTAVSQAQKDMTTGVQNEQTAEDQIKDQVNQQTQALQAKILQVQKNLNQLTTQEKQQLATLQNDLQKKQDDAQKILTSQRQQILNAYTNTVNAAGMACYKSVSGMVSSGMQCYDTSILLSTNSNGGAHNNTCSCTHATYNNCSDGATQAQQNYCATLQQAQNDMLQQLQSLQAQYQDDEADIQKTNRDMANVKSQTNRDSTADKQDGMNDVYAANQNLTLLNQKLMTMKQQFTMAQQMDQTNLAKAQQQYQVDSQQYNQDLATLNKLKASGIVPNSGDKSANNYSAWAQAINLGVSEQDAYNNFNCSTSANDCYSAGQLCVGANPQAPNASQTATNTGGPGSNQTTTTTTPQNNQQRSVSSTSSSSSGGNSFNFLTNPNGIQCSGNNCAAH